MTLSIQEAVARLKNLSVCPKGTEDEALHFFVTGREDTNYPTDDREMCAYMRVGATAIDDAAFRKTWRANPAQAARVLEQRMKALLDAS